MASLLHYTIVLSPKGQYMVSLMANVHKLTPYTLIRQTFKIGNVATMINAVYITFISSSFIVLSCSNIMLPADILMIDDEDYSSKNKRDKRHQLGRINKER